MFNVLKNNTELMQYCDKKFRKNYGFGWLGYFYTAYANGNNKAVFTVVDVLDILPQKKKQVWAKRFYECWVENLCEIVEYIPDVYQKKDEIPQETWKRMKLDSPMYCYRARVNGGLTQEIVKMYEENGMLCQVTKKIKRVEFYAKAPLPIIIGLHFLNKLYQFPMMFVYKVKNIIALNKLRLN